MEILYSQIKSFIDENSSFYSKKLVLVDSASTRLDLYINNGLKIFQNGEVILLPPINCVQEKSKIFNHRIKIGNVNQYKDIIIPSTFINTDSKNYKVSSNICNKDCPLLQNCQTGDKEIFVSDLLCRKTKLFIKLSNYCKGVNMTDKEYQDIRDNYCIYNAIVNLTDNCNLRCPYCFTEHNTRKIDMGTMKAAISFILKEVDRSDKKLIPSIAFFGGEPMLRYEDIIKPTIYWAEETGLVKNYNLRFTMTSNGTLFNEENLKFLSDHQVGLLLSMDGDKYTQDNQRPGVNGQSSFDMINTDLILKYYPGVTFRSAIEPRNVSHMLENYIFARNKGFKNYFITPNLYAEWTDDQLKIAMEQLACIAQVIYNDVSTDQTPLEWNDFKQTIQELFIPNEYKIDYGHCGIGTVSVGISTNGDLNGCQEHNTYIDHDIFYIGNIFTGIDKEKHKRLLSAFREKDHPVFKDNPNRCNSCEFYNHCASHFCPSYNMGNGSLIVNCKANCYWKQFVYNLALIWVQQAEIENNKKVLAYIENIVRDLKN